MKTVTEKYHAVNEGAMSKAEFVRQMRLSHPQFISQFNGFDDSVQILKNRGLLFEKKEEVEYENPSYNLSPDAVRRGLRYELELAGLDPAGDISEADYMKAHKKAEENIMKDQLHYYRMITHGETKVEHDKMKETKRGAQETDTDNAMAKVKLNEDVEAKAEVESRTEKVGKAILKDTEVMNTVKSFMKDAGLSDDKASIKRTAKALYSAARGKAIEDDSIRKALNNQSTLLEGKGIKDRLIEFGKLLLGATGAGAFIAGVGAALAGFATAPMWIMAGLCVALIYKVITRNDKDSLYEEDLEEKAKPDYLDLDKDGNKEETMKQAAADKKAMNEAEQKIKQALKKRIVKILKEGHEETLHMDTPQIEEPEHSDSSKLSSMVEDNQYSTEERKTLLKLDNLVNTVTGDTLSYQEQLRSTLSEFPADSQILDDALEAFKSDVNARFESAFSNMDSSKEEVKSEKEVEAMQQEQERLQQEMEKESKQTVFNENKKTK